MKNINTWHLNLRISHLIVKQISWFPQQLEPSKLWVRHSIHTEKMIMPWWTSSQCDETCWKLKFWHPWNLSRKGSGLSFDTIGFGILGETPQAFSPLRKVWIYGVAVLIPSLANFHLWPSLESQKSSISDWKNLPSHPPSKPSSQKMNQRFFPIFWMTRGPKNIPWCTHNAGDGHHCRILRIKTWARISKND